MIGSIYNKKVISIGLGYDSYVIIDHGTVGVEEGKKIIREHDKEWEKAEKFVDIENEASDCGCFFCSDYLAPSDTISSRSMD